MEIPAIVGVIIVIVVVVKIIRLRKVDDVDDFVGAVNNICERVRRDDALNEDMVCMLILRSLAQTYKEEEWKWLHGNNLVRFELYCLRVSPR